MLCSISCCCSLSNNRLVTVPNNLLCASLSLISSAAFFQPNIWHLMFDDLLRHTDMAQTQPLFLPRTIPIPTWRLIGKPLRRCGIRFIHIAYKIAHPNKRFSFASLQIQFGGVFTGLPNQLRIQRRQFVHMVCHHFVNASGAEAATHGKECLFVADQDEKTVWHRCAKW